MAISFVGSTTGSGNNPASGNWTLPAGWQSDDLAIVWWATNYYTKIITAPGTITQKHSVTQHLYGGLFIGYRRLQAGDATFTWTATSAGSSTTVWGVSVFRGVKTSGDPFGAESGVPQTFLEPASPDPPAVTPASDGSAIIAIFGKRDNTTFVTPPTNYSDGGWVSNSDGFDESSGLAYRLNMPSGISQNPGAWTLSAGTGSELNGWVWTGSLTEEVAAPPPPPPPPPPPTTGWYVSPTGTAGGDGSIVNPWNLQTALSHPASVQPGDTIWIRGGTYKGGFTSNLTGTAAAPIIVRNYPSEKAIIDTYDGQTVTNLAAQRHFRVFGPYTWYWGLEFMSSDPHSRISLEPIGSWGDQKRGTIQIEADHVKFINSIVHDLRQGFSFWSDGAGGEIYGTVIYNNGFQDLNGEGQAHAIYTQNLNDTKRIVDNVMFNSFRAGIHLFSTDSPDLLGYYFEGNSLFNAGGAKGVGFSRARNSLVGGVNWPCKDITFTKNYSYQNSRNGVVQFGYGVDGNENLVLTDNYLVGELWFTRAWSPITSSGNTVVGTVTGQNGTMVPGGITKIGTPSGTQVFVRPNEYEAGRGHVVIYNWGNASSISVDLSSVLGTGDSYEIRHVHNLSGAPLVSGTYSGGTVSIPMQDTVAPTLLGNTSGLGAPITLPKEFGTFLVTTTATAVQTGKDLIDRIAIRHNTFLDPNQTDQSASESSTFYCEGNTNPLVMITNLIVEDNVMHHLDEGFQGAPLGGNQFGTFALNGYVSGYSFTRNVFGGGNMTHNSPANYPAGNAHENDTTFQANFENYAANDFRLKATSPYKAGGAQPALDGTDRGADVTGVTAATLHCIDGDWT